MIGTHADITARRQAEIEREALDRKVQETQKLESLGVLAGGIAHDFNNLLTAILGNASIAQIELPPGSSAQDCLEHITEASLRAADLCKQMLAYSGRGRFVVQKLDLGELVEQTAQMLQISISKKAVLRYRLEKALPTVEVDATQIRQVIMNLVINASEAIGDASGVISISTGLTRVDRDYLHGTLMDPDLPEGDYVFLEVSDSGCGMDAETQARIFDPFFTTKFTGRGLGLAAVLGIVRGHGAAIHLRSEKGRGTTLQLRFPVAQEPPATVAGPAAPRPALARTGRVLLVDDEPQVRDVVRKMLERLGHTVVAAGRASEALEAFRSAAPEFVGAVIDLTLPDQSGDSLLDSLRRLRPDLPVLLSSGYDEQDTRPRLATHERFGFLRKPYTLTELDAALREILPAQGS
jgi:nitrogen-specific signal transduction histidine kinase/CheY-like chemotaxis protein